MATITSRRTRAKSPGNMAGFPNGRMAQGETSVFTAPNGFTYGAIVEVVYGLSLEERLDLKNLLDHNITETRRAGILKNGQDAKMAEKNNELVFSDDIGKLRTML